VGAAAGIGWLLAPALGAGVPLMLFILAVTASAWLGGVGPGLLATLVSILAAQVLSLQPQNVVPITHLGHAIRIVLFGLAGISISVISETRRRAAARADDAVTQAEQRGAELARSEARFRRIVETAQEGIWHIDAEGTTVYANLHLAEMLGYRPEELLGRSAFDLVPEEDLAHAREAWSRRTQGRAEKQEFRFRRKDGRVVWLRAAATPLEEDGRFAGAFAMLTDVTEARQSEEALRASEARKATQLAVTEVLAEASDVETAVRRILETAGRGLGWRGGAFWRVDRDANVLRCAETWAEPARSLDEFMEASRRITFPPGVGLPGRVWTSLEGAWIPEVGEDTNFLRKAEAKGAGLRSAFAFPVTVGRECLGVIEFFSETRRESDLELMASFLGVGSQAGQFLERARIARERKLLLESEQGARREAEAANRAKDEFLATLSHELRTPLNAIVGWSHLLRTGQLDDAQRTRAIEVIDRNAKAQSQIVADVLDVSRIVMGKLRLEVRPVELSAVVDEAMDTLRPAAAAKEIHLESQLSAGGRVSGDPDRLQQVVWNLLSNAIKFTPSGGHIRVLLRRADGHAEIVVEDTGSGIRPEFLPHVFERFRQSDSSSTRAHGGLGLGLALVRHLVELHGGTAAAASAGEGRGATFVVRLPLMLDAREERSESALAVDLAGLQVLVVDEDGDARARVATALRRLGAHVRTAGTVGEAVADVDRHPPSVIVSDLELPGAHGDQLIRRLRANLAKSTPDEIARAVAALARPQREH
jgi:PAS domain S-box-containing protein